MSKQTGTDFLAEYRDQPMDESLLDEPSTHTAKVGNSTHLDRPEVPDITDTFNLFKTYLDTKLENLKDQLSSEILSDLSKLQKRLSVRDSSSACIVSSVITKLTKRNKLIRIADKSPAGWTTVREYESDDLASDSDDEKRMRQAENRAIRSLKEKRRYQPF